VSFRKVKSGERLAIPAQAYNAFVDAARAHQDGRHGSESAGRELFRQTGIVYVRNDSGTDRNRFDVLGIDSPIVTPSEGLDEFKNRVALECSTPDEASHQSKFVILQEPVADGEITRACVAGVCPARVDISDTSHAFADIADGVASSLASGSAGSAHILWAEAGTGVKWAVVRLGPPLEALPVGAIIEWALGVGTIPSGWALCDGQDHSGTVTVDKRGRFTVGYDPRTGGQLPGWSDAAYNTPGTTGGAKTHAHSDHEHHTHTVPAGTEGAGGTSTWLYLVDCQNGQTSNESPTLTHDSQDHRPPWYVTVYIQKIA